jgi:hypothetical protein
MILDFLYNHSLWLVGSVIVLVPVVLSCLALKLFHHVIPYQRRYEHNEYTGYIIAVIGINYAILIAFVAVAVWGSFDKATATADREADLVGNIYRNTRGLGEPATIAIRTQLKSYVNTVVKEEWPAMARVEYPVMGWQPLEQIQNVLEHYQPQAGTQTVYMQEILLELNQLFDARRERLAASEKGVEPVVWVIVVMGTCLTIAFTFLFGMPSLRMHMMMTGGLTAATMLVLVLIISFDWPFRGSVQVDASMFNRVMENMQALDSRGG